mmetsp:Transcript_27042/g.65620  ORF Transcript_27042/g.65620 Transcript_27042/m.65620 type:complete len:99 (+) Transcript_27042:1909-2205(+)
MESPRLKMQKIYGINSNTSCNGKSLMDPKKKSMRIPMEMCYQDRRTKTWLDKECFNSSLQVSLLYAYMLGCVIFVYPNHSLAKFLMIATKSNTSARSS